MTSWASSFLSALFVSVYAISSAAATTTNATNLHVNVLVGKNGESAFQCWSVQPAFIISQQAGTVGAKIQQIGASNGSTIVYFDEKHTTDAGLHAAPAPQWVLIIKGSGVLSVPASKHTLSLPTGSVIIAVDTANVSKSGHRSVWAPGTVAVQLPFTGGVFPNHTVVNDGSCETPAGHHNY